MNAPRPLAHGTIRIARRFGAPGRRVFDAWLDPGIARQWLFATATRPLAQVEIDPRITGSFRFVERLRGKTIEHRGHYVEILPHRRLAFTLSVENHPDAVARVTVAIAPARTGCTLTLTHEGVPPDCAAHTRARWTGMLYGLGVTLDMIASSPNLLRAPAAAPISPTTPLMEPAMKYLLLVCRDEKSLNAMPPGDWNALVSETNAYLDTLRKSGHYVAAEALESVETATTVQIRNGKLSTTDGPFAETKEQIGGFILVEAPNLDDAIRIAAAFPPARHGKVEVRPVKDFTARSSTLPRSE